MNQKIFSAKKEYNLKLKEKYWFLKKEKAIWLVKLSNKNLIIELRDAFLDLPVAFIIEMENIETEKLWKNIVATSKVPESYLVWLDFVICDKDISSLKKYLENWVTPIISQNNPLKSILKEFNPIKNEWNSFIYENENKWSIFYSLVRYLENYKFPFDCRITMWLFPMKTRQSLLPPTFCRVSANLFLTLRILFLKLKTTLFPQIWSSSCQSLFVIMNIFPPLEEQLSKIEIFILIWFSSASEFWLQKAVIKPKIKAFVFCRICIFWSPKCEMQMYFLYFLLFVKKKNIF